MNIIKRRINALIEFREIHLYFKTQYILMYLLRTIFKIKQVNVFASHLSTDKWSEFIVLENQVYMHGLIILNFVLGNALSRTDNVINPFFVCLFVFA